jgi:hypothetical protein
MPTTPQPTVLGPRKRHAPLNANGDPVIVPALKKKKSAPNPGPPKKATPISGRAKLVPAKKPRNSQNAIEASDGSDDDDSDDDSDPLPPAMDVDADSGDEEVVEVEKPEEDAEAELGVYYLLSITDD